MLVIARLLERRLSTVDQRVGQRPAGPQIGQIFNELKLDSVRVWWVFGLDGLVWRLSTAFIN
jgi:hypothetical protein